MSNVNIKRAVENIRANTTAYTPIVEMIGNGIQAIDETGRQDGQCEPVGCDEALTARKSEII